MSRIKLIASYLPQFHPIPENDEWHGKGFTEWFNVGKSKPLFKDHYQPRVPTELGYYDLRVPEVQQAQADLAREYGIYGFCYWHYWFGNGKQLLQMPLEKVIESGTPDFPFCLGWANETWQGIDHGVKSRILIRQEYPGTEDDEKHFYKMLPVFADKRYIRHKNKLVFLIYKPLDIPDFARFKKQWNELAIKNGLPGFIFIAHINNAGLYDRAVAAGYDMINIVRIRDIEIAQHGALYSKIRWRLGLKRVYEYKDAIRFLIGEEEKSDNCIPTMVPNWDHSPRSGKNALIYHNSTPELFAEHAGAILKTVATKSESEQLVFVKSWNEWGESNYLEPDLRYGRQYLEKLKTILDQIK